jgi:toxin YoeB
LKLIFSESDWEEYLYWQKTDKKMVQRINELIKAIVRTPCDGIGKPEPLKHGLKGYWLRRINDEHRVVYKIQDDSLLIAQCKYHYWHNAV